MNFDILVIGAGPAGMWATIYGVLHNKKICVIESTKYIGGQPVMLYSEKKINDIPGFIEIRAGEYATNLIKQFEYYKDDYSLFLETKLESWILDKEDEQYICFLSNNVTLKTKYIIFATGLGEFIPKKLTNTSTNFQEERINYIIKNLKKFINKKVLIFGGGDSAVDWANALIEDEITNNVSLVHHTNKYRAMQNSIKRLKENNVKEYLNYSLDNLEENNAILINNETNNMIKVSYDEIICMYGIQPNKNHLFNSEIFEMKANKFLTDHSQKTNIKNIFAIGQACIYDNRPNLIIVAQAEASIAIKTIINEERMHQNKIK